MWRRLTIAALVLLVAAGCGDDDGGRESASEDAPAERTTTTVDQAAFCAALADVQAIDAGSLPRADDVATIESAQAVAVDEGLAEGLAMIAAYGQRLVDFDPSDAAAFADINADAYEPDLIQAADDLREYALYECELREVSVFEQFAVIFLRRVALGFYGSCQAKEQKIVERLRVGRVDFGGTLPPEDRLTPQPFLGHRNAELHLFLSIIPRVGVGGRCSERRQQGEHDQSLNHDGP